MLDNMRSPVKASDISKEIDTSDSELAHSECFWFKENLRKD